MESKEYIEDIIKRIEKFTEKYNDCNEHIKSQLEHYKQVLKDLERLALLEETVSILKPYCYIEWDEVNDAFYFNVDASERIPLSEDYEINRCIIGLDDSDIDILKEVF